MLRTTRSTPTPPTPEDATSPVPAAPAVRLPTQTPIERLLRWLTRRPCWKTSLASSRLPWGRVWSWFSSLVRPTLGSAGASAGGAVVFDAAESRQPDEQTQANKDQVGLITERHSPEVRTVVRVSTALRYHVLIFICTRTMFLYY